MADPTTWKRRVAEWRASGMTAAEFAAGRGFAPTTLKWWSSRLGRQADAPTRAPIAMARVLREPEPRPNVTAPVLLDLGGVRITVSPGFDRATLLAVLSVVEERR